jgi:hypothetical protein
MTEQISVLMQFEKVPENASCREAWNGFRHP